MRMFQMRSSRLTMIVLVSLGACGDNLHPLMPDGHFPDGPAPDGLVTDAMPCMAATLPAVFGSLVNGDLVIDVTQSENTAALSVDLGNSVLFASMREIES